MNEEETTQYFTEELDSAIREMSEQEMYNELENLESTRTWLAILKYNASRISYAQQAVNTTDPVKEPTFIARSQGIMLGISDLQNAVISLVEEKKKIELQDNKE